MEYTKPPLTFEEQADLLLSRGIKADRNHLVFRLRTVNYYRLSAYLYPFRARGGDTFQEKTTLDLVWKYYTFDRQLRLVVMDAIERVEIAVRTQLIYHFVHRHGVFGYADVANNRLFAILTILEYMRKKIAPTSGWNNRLKELFIRYPEIPLELMGFPQNWEQSKIWSDFGE